MPSVGGMCIIDFNGWVVGCRIGGWCGGGGGGGSGLVLW